MKRDYDSINLIYDAEFITKITKNIEWVPTAILGRTKRSGDQASLIWQLPVDERKQYINNLYEAMQLFHISSFVLNENKRIIECGDSIWEVSKDGREAVRDNCGMCAECAAWLIYFLNGIYEETGFLTLIGTKLGGHIINYIKDNGYYYFVDMSMQVSELAVHNAIENGDIREFRKNKHVTCSMLRAKRIEDFYSFYSSFYRRRMSEFISFYYTGDCAVPIGYEKASHTILLPRGYGVNLIEASRKKDDIRWKVVELPYEIRETCQEEQDEAAKCQ